MKNQDYSNSNIYTYHILVMVLSASVFGIVGSVTKHYVIVFIALIPYIISAFAIIKIRKSEQNSTHPNAPTPKENPTILNKNPSLSPNISEVVKLTKKVESIKDSFKVINYEVDDSIFAKFGFLKNTVYARINKIDWQNNKNPELVKKYQAVVDSYVGKLDDEYLNIKKQFDDIVDNDVKHEIDNVNLID